MRKLLLVFIVFLLFPAFVHAQQFDPNWGYPTRYEADSLKKAILIERNDTVRMAAYRTLGFYYADAKLDSSLYFHEQQLALAKKLNIKMWIADGYSQVGYITYFMGNVIRGYENFMEAEKIASDEKNENSNWHYWVFSNTKNLRESRLSILAMNYNGLGSLNYTMGESSKGREAYEKGIRLGEMIGSGKVLATIYGNLASKFTNDSLFIYAKKAIHFTKQSGYKRNYGSYLLLVAQVYYVKKQYDSAMYYAYASKVATHQQNNLRMLGQTYSALIVVHGFTNNTDSIMYYAREMHSLAKSTRVRAMFLNAYTNLSYAYSLKKRYDSAYRYEQLSFELNDSLKNVRINQLTDFQKSAFNEQLLLKQLNDDETAKRNSLKLYAAIGGLTALLFVALILYRSNRQKQRSNSVLEQTLTDLKSAQSQLIQSEKMASLGELTAGIAHEIQNPLNFVNNFSEINTELIDELQQEATKGNLSDVITIAKDIKGNEEKINHHGKRADAIVKGMLQHSRASSGQKELTDINALTDEYLRLAYHGLRAKDKSFNATLKTEYDESAGKVNVVPQDIGRVILNLITNAFYAVGEKSKENIPGYEPTVLVSTFVSLSAGRGMSEGQGERKIEISVRDNGNGIPDKIRDKIFQPFFTTKPTGQGTGLGLSLSYDIIKAHGGDLKVETIDGTDVNSKTETIFVIQLPIN